MTKTNISAVLLGGLLAFFSACKAYEELDFFGVKTLRPTPGAVLGTVVLSDSLFSVGAAGVETHGFYWSEDKNKIDYPRTSTAKIELGPSNQNGTAQTVFRLPDALQTYYFRAFATVDGRFVVAPEVEPFALSLSPQIEHNLLKSNNNMANLAGRALGLDRLNAGNIQYGWTWATNTRTPTPGPNAHLEKTKVNKSDELLFDTIKGLEPATLYYVRFFIRSNTDVFYSPVDSVQIKDVWNTAPTPFDGKSVWGTFQATVGNRAYVGCGCTEPEDVRDGRRCLEGNLVNEIWEFDGEKQLWRKLPVTFDSDNKRANATAIALNGDLYIGLGSYLGDNDFEMLYSDWWKLDLQTFQLTQMPDFPGRGRNDAVAFSIDGQAYVGAGRGIVNLQEAFFNDFYQFDPKTGWTQIDSMPLFNNGMVFYDRGRKGAVAFNHGRFGYVAGGQYSIEQLSDCWIFDPARGKWFQGPSLPAARQDAQSFVIGDKAYWGLGWDKYKGFQTDWYALDLKNAQSWQSANHFRGQGRADAFNFSLQGKGYIGTGRSVNITGIGFDPVLLGDMWEYVPFR